MNLCLGSVQDGVKLKVLCLIVQLKSTKPRSALRVAAFEASRVEAPVNVKPCQTMSNGFRSAQHLRFPHHVSTSSSHLRNIMYNGAIRTKPCNGVKGVVQVALTIKLLWKADLTMGVLSCNFPSRCAARFSEMKVLHR